MKPEKKVSRDENSAYVQLGIPEEWIPIIQKMGYLTIEELKLASPGKLFNDLCGMNKKHKLGLTNPTANAVKSWLLS